MESLQLIQCKNDSTQSKNVPVLKLPRFFSLAIQVTKKSGNFKTRKFLTELCRSYIVLALTRLNLVLFRLCSVKPISVKKNSCQSHPTAESNVGAVVLALVSLSSRMLILKMDRAAIPKSSKSVYFAMTTQLEGFCYLKHV